MKPYNQWSHTLPISGSINQGENTGEINQAVMPGNIFYILY